MEEHQEQRFMCKFCSKTFSSGKSLGGHMRGHLALIAAQKSQENDNGVYDLRENHNKASSSRVSEPQEGSEDSYGLRENPKKSWRISDSKPSALNSEKENLCKECGKGFQSLRALSGHMRCHSTKGKEINQCQKCGKGFDSMRAMFGHMRSHSKRSAESKSDYETTTAFPIPRKRLRTRYKITPNPSCSNLNNSSSNVAETDDDDGVVVVEAATCLMMLSTGVRNWDCFSSVTNTSINDSVILEAEILDGIKGLRDDYDETLKVKKPREKMGSCVSDSGNALAVKNISEFGDFDENKAELEVSVDGSLSSDQQDDESENGLFDTDIEKGFNPTELKLEMGVTIDVGLDLADSEFMKSYSGKDAELGGNFCERTKYTTNDSGILKDPERKHEYKCRSCDKIFNSHQALGGHQTCHKTANSSLVPEVEKSEKSIQKKLLSDIEAYSEVECNGDSLEQEVGGERKGKDHECSVCFKVFASGQALGGHKRAHYIGLADSRAKETMLVRQELSDIHNIFDLNLPVTMEEGATGDVGFKPWWVGSDHECEPLVIN